MRGHVGSRQRQTYRAAEAELGKVACYTSYGARFGAPAGEAPIVSGSRERRIFLVTIPVVVEREFTEGAAEKPSRLLDGSTSSGCVDAAQWMPCRQRAEEQGCYPQMCQLPFQTDRLYAPAPAVGNALFGSISRASQCRSSAFRPLSLFVQSLVSKSRRDHPRRQSRVKVPDGSCR